MSCEFIEIKFIRRNLAHQAKYKACLMLRERFRIEISWVPMHGNRWLIHGPSLGLNRKPRPPHRRPIVHHPPHPLSINGKKFDMSEKFEFGKISVMSFKCCVMQYHSGLGFKYQDYQKFCRQMVSYG